MFAVAGEQVFCDFEDAPGEVWTVPVFADPPAATFTGGTASYKAYCTGKGFPLAGRGVTAAKAWLVQKRMLHLSSHALKASGQGSGVLSMPLGYTFDGTCGEVPFLPYSIYDNTAATLPPNIAGDHCNEDCAGQRICGYYDGATVNGWTDADLTVYPDPEDWDDAPSYASCMYLEPADVKLDLAGGTGGAAGETVHTIAGVATVTASNPVYDNGVYYNMDNLFDGDTSPADVHDTYWLAQNEAASCDDACKPGGTYDGPGDMSGCTSDYCSATYGLGGTLTSRCTPGADGHAYAVQECQQTCGICTEAESTLTFRFPAALELSRVSLGRGYAVILHKTDCKNGDLFSKLPFLNCHFCHFLHIKRKRDENK
jgi:hypothetical protein